MAAKPLEASVLSERLANVWKNLKGYENSFGHTLSKKNVSFFEVTSKETHSPIQAFFPHSGRLWMSIGK